MQTYEQPMERDDGDDSDAEVLAGGDFIQPGVSPEARAFVTKCREMLYNEKFTPILKQALSGGQDLASGVAPVVAQIVLQAENKMGPLNDDDLQSVLLALSGTIAGFAHMLEDPDAEDIPTATQEIAEGALEIMHHQSEPDEGAPADEQAPGEEPDPQQPPPTMAAMQTPAHPQ